MSVSPPPVRLTYTLPSFVGGYYSPQDSDPLMTPKQYLVDVANIRYDAGYLQKSLGTALIGPGTVSGQIQLLYVFDRPDGSHILMIMTTTSLYVVDAVAGTYTDISPPGGLHGVVGETPMAITWLDQVFFTNTVDPIVNWDGRSGNATFITGNGAPVTCVSLVVFAGQLFALAPTTVAGRQGWEADWSDFRNPHAWNTGQAGGIVLDDTPEPIEAAEIIGRTMVIFKQERTVYVVTSVAAPVFFDFARLDIPSVYGRRTLVRVPVLGLFYQGIRDQYIFDGVTATPIAKPIRREMNDIYNLEARDTAVAWVDEIRGRIYCSLPTAQSPTPNLIYTYSYTDGQYFKEIRPVVTGTSVNVERALLVQELVNMVDSYNVEIQNLVAGELEGFLTSEGGGVDLNVPGLFSWRGTPIPSTFQTAVFAPGTDQQTGNVLPVTLYEIILVLNPLAGQLGVTVQAAWGNMVFKEYGPYFVTQNAPIEIVIPVEISGMYFQLGFFSEGLGTGFQLKQVRMRCRVRARV